MAETDKCAEELNGKQRQQGRANETRRRAGVEGRNRLRKENGNTEGEQCKQTARLQRTQQNHTGLQQDNGSRILTSHTINYTATLLLLLTPS